MSPTIIRKTDWNNPADCTAVVDLIDAYAQEPIEGAEPLPTSTRERLVEGLRNEPGALVLLAIEDEQPVGIAVCFRGFSTFAAQPLINIHDLAVLREHRNQGIGGLLLEEVCRRAQGAGCCKVTLEVRDTNEAAQRLYRRHGFGDPSGKGTWFFDKPLGSIH